MGTLEGTGDTDVRDLICLCWALEITFIFNFRAKEARCDSRSVKYAAIRKQNGFGIIPS